MAGHSQFKNIMFRKGKQDKERWFVLFSDILIYAAFDPTKLSLKHEVLLLDRGEPGHGCSWGNAGILAAQARDDGATR